MTKKKVIIISLISIFLLTTTLIIYKILTPNKKTSLEKATIYLKNKINSEIPYYTKTTTTGDIKNCANCTRPNGGHVFYGFFISKAIGNLLTEVEKNKLLTNINIDGSDLWSYNGKEVEKSLNDSDDTAFAMRTLEGFNIKYNLYSINYFYNKENKEFVSFKNNEIMKAFPENFKAHPEVNANIYSLFNETKQDHHSFEINKELIKSGQNEDGSFNSFYYSSKYYPTYMFLDFLCNYKNIDEELTEVKDKGINFILNTQNTNGSWGKDSGNNFETALALVSLKVCKQNGKQMNDGKNFLTKQQNANGSWTSENEALWTFSPKENEKWVSYVNDVLSTSLAIMALK